MKITHNRYLNAFLLFLLVCAVIHFTLLVVVALQQQSLHVLNLFVVVGISHFFPQTGIGWASDILSLVIAVAMYIIILRANKS